MRISTLIIALTALTGCTSGAGSDALDELLVSSLSGEEDYIGSETYRSAGDDDAEGDRAAPPPMFRECDAEGTYIGLFSAYDEDGSGALEAPEEDDVIAEHAGRGPGPRMHLLHMLRVVYDVDMDQEFSADEQSAIFEDFTVRCEAIHAAVLAEFDADGDGALSEDEQAEAEAAHLARMADARESMEACRASCEGGGPGGEGRGEGPPAGEGLGERPDGPPWGPLEEEFDADGDGALSDAELEVLRDELRQRIRSGERPHPECEDAPVE